jgi:6-phosphogluconate dehydrogenase
MRVAIIGLGRMGAGIARRLMRAGHEIIALTYRRLSRLAEQGAIGAGSLEAPPGSRARKCSGSCCRRARSPKHHRQARRSCRATRYPDRWRQLVLQGRYPPPKALAAKDIAYVDVGTSGGVWGFDRGFSMMVGGPAEAVADDRPDPRIAGPGHGCDRAHRRPC